MSLQRKDCPHTFWDLNNKTYTKQASGTMKKSMGSQSTSYNTMRKTFNGTNIRDLIFREANQKYPFNLGEERFKWQNLVINQSVTLNDDDRKTKTLIKQNSCLVGGFERFYNKRENALIEKKMKRNNSMGMLANTYNYGMRSMRVVRPEKDYDRRDYEVKRSKKDATGAVRTLNHSAGGSMSDLFHKTPKAINYRGKKTGYRGSVLNIFCDDHYNKFAYPKGGKRVGIKKESNFIID